jgi:hypothetical protein
MPKSEILIAQGRLSGNQSNQEVIAAVAGKIISIVSAKFTRSTVGTVSLLNKAAATELLPILDSGSSDFLEVKSARAQGINSIAETAVGDGVGVTTTGGGALSYIIEYYTEP